MKLFAKVMLAVLVIAMLLPFTILKDDDGHTLMSLSDISLPDFSMPSLTNELPQVDAPGGSLLKGEDRVYQWYDGDGNIQFTTDPPPQGVDFEVRSFDPDANVIKSVELPRENQAVTGEGAETASADPSDIGNPYSGENLRKLFEDARNVEKLLERRFQNQESQLNQ